MLLYFVLVAFKKGQRNEGVIAISDNYKFFWCDVGRFVVWGKWENWLLRAWPLNRLDVDKNSVERTFSA